MGAGCPIFTRNNLGISPLKIRALASPMKARQGRGPHCDTTAFARPGSNFSQCAGSIRLTGPALVAQFDRSGQEPRFGRKDDPDGAAGEVANVFPEKECPPGLMSFYSGRRLIWSRL